MPKEAEDGTRDLVRISWPSTWVMLGWASKGNMPRGDRRTVPAVAEDVILNVDSDNLNVSFLTPDEKVH
jgi:hypothetical protein